MNSLMTLLAKAERHEAEIKELRDEIKDLTAVLQQGTLEWQRDQEKANRLRQLADKDHELLLSRLETRIVRYECGLLSSYSLFDENTP